MKYIAIVITLACLASCTSTTKVDQDTIDITSYGFIPGCMKEEVQVGGGVGNMSSVYNARYVEPYCKLYRDFYNENHRNLNNLHIPRL